MKLNYFTKIIILYSFFLLQHTIYPWTQQLVYDPEQKIEIDEHFKSFLKVILSDALEKNQEDTLSNELLRCIVLSFDKDCTAIPFGDLAEALPELAKAVMQQLKTSRPSIFSARYVGGPTCNLSGIIRLLIALQQQINQCCQAQLDCCAELESDFQQTWTILAYISDHIGSTTITVDFSPVFTVLSAGFNGTFTALNACCENITSEFQQTWTILADIRANIGSTTAIVDFAPVFTAIAACCNGTFSAINTINFTYSVITDLKATMTNDFEYTWTILAAGFNGTFSAINTISNASTFSALAACCNGTFSAIAALNTTMTNDFEYTWTILAAGFNGTFSAINAISASTNCNGTFSALAACCNGTFSAIAALNTTMTNDFEYTWTILGAGFNGTFSTLNQILTNQGC